MRRTGWGWITAIVVVFFTAGMLYSSRLSREDRGPVVRPNPAASPATVDTVGGVLHVATPHPAHLIVPDTVPPAGVDVALLWFQGRAAVPGPDGRVALDAAGAPIVFDDRLFAHRLPWRIGTHEPASVAPTADGGWWIATRTGAVYRVGSDGQVADSAAPPYDFSWVVTTATGDVWAFRSPDQFAFPFGQPVAPLVVPVTAEDGPDAPARRPANPLFAHLVNAGRVLPAPDGGFFYAPFIRDEIIRFSADGDTVWVATRGLPHGVEEPSIELGEDGPVLDYAPVNIGFQQGPEGMLYVLSTPGHTTERARLDRIDPDSGIVRATVELPTALPTLAVDRTGRVYLLDDLELLTGIAPTERVPAPAFDLEALDGGRVRLEDYRDKVVLVNVWASWCEPCREEMPALDSLRHEFPADRFALVALSDDVRPAQARAFIEEYGFTFPVGLGKGKLRNQFHYMGLPFTALVDPDGRLIYRWTGYGGESQIQMLTTMIQAELERTAETGDSAAMGAEHGHAH